MKTGFLSLLALSMLLISACKKEKTLDENKVKAEEFRVYLAGKSFRAASFTSDKPIDYIQTDNVVKAETDLWPYVKPNIVDDTNTFTAPSTLTIFQNEIKLPGNDSPVIELSYSITADKKSVILEFVDYEYKPLRYRLKEFSDNHITLYVEFKNEAILTSRFDRVNN